MKNKIISSSSKRKLCLMTFILLCSVFPSKNAFSIKWDHHHMAANYFPDENAIDVKFIFHENAPETPNSQNYMRRFEILYSEDNYHFTSLLTGVSLSQMVTDKRWITVTDTKKGEKINFVNGKEDPVASKIWFQIKKGEYKDGKVWKKSAYCSINFKWISPRSKYVKAIKIKGIWKSVNDNPIEETYQL